MLKEFIRRWRADTPGLAKAIRNIAGTITAIVPTAWLTFQGMGITLPSWFVNNIGYITFASLLITGYAGLKEKKQ